VKVGQNIKEEGLDSGRETAQHTGMQEREGEFCNPFSREEKGKKIFIKEERPEAISSCEKASTTVAAGNGEKSTMNGAGGGGKEGGLVGKRWGEKRVGPKSLLIKKKGRRGRKSACLKGRGINIRPGGIQGMGDESHTATICVRRRGSWGIPFNRKK